MRYVLGIDIGGTSTSAALSRLNGRTWSRPEIVRLGHRSRVVASVLQVSADGSFAVGDPGRGGYPPEGSRIARDFVRRVGDDVPMVVAGVPYRPQALAAMVTMWVVERVRAQEGTHPEQIVLAHPATWGPYRRRLLQAALRDIGLTNVALVPKPVTAAESHSFDGFAGGTLAVYALGGAGFTASVVRRTHPAGFQVLRCVEGVEPLGGAEFDEMLADHVRAALGRRFGVRHLDDPQVRRTLTGLREECVRAKETLTAATGTDVRLHLPNGPVRVPVSRAEFEEMIRPALHLTVDVLVRTVRSCGLRPDQLDGVLLMGGSSRIPLVAELVAARFPGTVTVDADPEVTAAAGAALAGWQILSLAMRRRQEPDGGRQPDVAYPDGDPSMPPQEHPNHGEDEHDEPPPRPPVKVTPLELPKPRSVVRLIPGRSSGSGQRSSPRTGAAGKRHHGQSSRHPLPAAIPNGGGSRSDAIP
jgi:molecular chaperone DnaK